jgi:hypothetical protein
MDLQPYNNEIIVEQAEVTTQNLLDFKKHLEQYESLLEKIRHAQAQKAKDFK